MKRFLKHAFDATIFTLIIILWIFIFAAIGKVIDKLFNSIDFYGFVGWCIVLGTIWLLALFVSYKYDNHGG